MQEELENIKRGFRSSKDISEENFSTMEMKPVFLEEDKQQPQSLEQIDTIYEPEFTQNLQPEETDEQELLLYSSNDPILTHIINDFNFGDYNQLEKPYSLDELFPSFW